MEEIRLKDICDLDNGYAFKSDDYVESSNTLNCRMSNIRPDGSFDILYSAKYLPDEFVKKYKNYVLNDGDLIIAMTDMAGDPKILGVPTVVDTKGYKLLLNQRVGRLRFIRDGINADYLKFALQCKRVRDYLKMFAGGGVQLNVSKKDILNAPIRMRAIGEQQSIADLLKRIIKLQKLREQELQHFDNLIKARFVELYNTSFLGEETTIEAITERVKVGFVGTCEKYYTSNSGIPMLRTGNITNNGINLSDLKYVTNDFHEKNKKSQILEGDILIARHGSNGQANVYYGPEAQCLNAVVIVPNNEIATSVFLAGLINSPMVKEQIVRTLVGSTQHVVNTKSIAGLVVRIPNLEVQKEYEDFVNQIDKSKVVVSSKIKNAIFAIMLSVSFGQITSI